MIKAHFFPTGSRIFQTADGNVGPTRWGIWVFYFQGTPKDTAVCMVTGPSKGEQQLRVRVSDECEVVRPAEALIDTGAEVCIARKGTVPPEFFRPSQRPLQSVGANANRLESGDKAGAWPSRAARVCSSASTPSAARHAGRPGGGARAWCTGVSRQHPMSNEGTSLSSQPSQLPVSGQNHTRREITKYPPTPMDHLNSIFPWQQSLRLSVTRVCA